MNHSHYKRDFMSSCETIGVILSVFYLIHEYARDSGETRRAGAYSMLPTRRVSFTSRACACIYRD